jgi:hypothetical protein
MLTFLPWQFKASCLLSAEEIEGKEAVWAKSLKAKHLQMLTIC